MRSFSRKTKSNFIFWGILLLVTGYLFLTPSGEKTRSWLSSLTLSSPSIVLEKNTIKVVSNWHLTSTEGNQVLISDLKKPVFINIWATWCPPCRSELPSIIELYTEYKDKVDFVLVSPNESIEELKKFGSKNGYTLPFFVANNQIPDELKTRSYPTTYILNSSKEIAVKSIGAHDWNTKNVHEILDQLIIEQVAK